MLTSGENKNFNFNLLFPGYLILKHLFVYLGFYVTYNTVYFILQKVVLWAEETSTYSWCQCSLL